MLKPTKHFEKNYRKRTGNNRKSLYDFISRACSHPIFYKDIEGKLKCYLTNILVDEVKKNTIIYDKYVIIGDDRSNAVTILNLPTEYISKCRSLVKKKYNF